MKKILIDGRFVGVGESMTRYTLEILKGILELDRENEYTLLVRPVGVGVVEEWLGVGRRAWGENSPNAKHQTPNLKIEVLDIPHYSLSEQTKLLDYLNHEKYDLVHFIQFNHPILYKRPFVVTVHDLTMVGYFHRTNPIKKLAFSQVMKSAVKDSKKIITVSAESKKEIRDYYKPPAEKIEVIYNGIDHARYNIGIKNQELRIKQFKERYGIAGDYLLYTGMWKKHKNLVRLLKAFEQVSKARSPKPEALQLVLVGKIDKDEPEVMAEINRINSSLFPSPRSAGERVGVRGSNSTIQQFNNSNPNQEQGKPVIATGYVEEDDLPLAYAGALAYIMPSLSEGFGIPPLEAMACGTPVISSNVSCMPEILGDAALYFDPYNVDEMAEAIEKITSNEELRTKLSKKGLDQAKKYSWNKTSKKTLEVYKSLF